MENNNLIVSFVDKSLTVQRYDNRTVAKIKSGFKVTRLESLFTKSGFKGIPEFVLNILDENGYKKDNKINMYVTKCVGVSKCSDEDNFDEVKGRRVAVSRAKRDAYNKALNVMCDIQNMIFDINYVCESSIMNVIAFDENEEDAIQNVIEYGVSNPNK